MPREVHRVSEPLFIPSLFAREAERVVPAAIAATAARTSRVNLAYRMMERELLKVARNNAELQRLLNP